MNFEIHHLQLMKMSHLVVRTLSVQTCVFISSRSSLLEAETVTNIQNQGKRNEGTIKWKILYIQAKNYPNGVVLE